MNLNFRIGSNKGEGALWVDVTLQVVAALQYRAVSTGFQPVSRLC